MKERWQNLAERERKMLMGGGIALALILVYLLIWSPLSSKVDSLRDSMEKEQKLLAWMQEADKQLQTFKPSTGKAQVFTSPAALLSWLQTSIQQADLTQNLTQLKTRANDSVELQMQNVSFDAFVGWLLKAQEQQHFKITQFSAAKTATPGVVQVTLILSV